MAPLGNISTKKKEEKVQDDPVEEPIKEAAECSSSKEEEQLPPPPRRPPPCLDNCQPLPELKIIIPEDHAMHYCHHTYRLLVEAEEKLEGAKKFLDVAIKSYSVDTAPRDPTPSLMVCTRGACTHVGQQGVTRKVLPTSYLVQVRAVKHAASPRNMGNSSSASNPSSPHGSNASATNGSSLPYNPLHESAISVAYQPLPSKNPDPSPSSEPRSPRGAVQRRGPSYSLAAPGMTTSYHRSSYGQKIGHLEEFASVPCQDLGLRFASRSPRSESSPGSKDGRSFLGFYPRKKASPAKKVEEEEEEDPYGDFGTVTPTFYGCENLKFDPSFVENVEKSESVETAPKLSEDLASKNE